MRYLVMLCLCVMSFAGMAATQSGSASKSLSSDLTSSVMTGKNELNRHSYDIQVFKGDSVIWSDIISESHDEAHKTVGSVVFVAGTNMPKAKCADLFVGTVTFGDTITMRSGEYEVEVPGDETYTGICFQLEVGKESTSVFLQYRVTVKRVM